MKDEQTGRNNRVLLMKCIKNLDEFTDFNESLNINFSVEGQSVNFADIASAVVNYKKNAQLQTNTNIQTGQTKVNEFANLNEDEAKQQLFCKLDSILKKRHEYNKNKNITNVVVWISCVSKGEPIVDDRYPIDIEVKISKYGLSAA